MLLFKSRVKKTILIIFSNKKKFLININHFSARSLLLFLSVKISYKKNAYKRDNLRKEKFTGPFQTYSSERAVWECF
jgi:hypothetical protein